MLPDALFTTYRQYKEDTKKVIEWLAGTAHHCGYNSTDSSGKQPKLKGRARKLARDAAKDPQKNAKSGGEYVVKTNEFVPMAEVIANNTETKVIIPLSIMKTWKRCIAARSTTAKWYETATDSSDEDTNNQGHAFFIEILKNALQVIVPIAKLQELDKNQFKLNKLKSPAVEASGQTANRFSHLEIQDIDETIYETLPSAATDSKVKTPLPAPKKYKLEDLDEINEYLFALGCFMEDVISLQEQVKGFWERYADAELDLTTVSVTTNVAVEMVKRAEEEFNKLKQPSIFKRKMDGEGIPMMYFIECVQRDGVNPKSMRDANTKFFVPMDAWEQAQESYLHLERFLKVYSNGTTPGLYGADRMFAITRPAFYGTYNPELEFDDITPERQYEQIAAIVNDMLATLGGFAMFAETPNDDMLLYGIAELQRNQIDPPFWLLFAVQNFVDIHFILKTRSERPYEELRDFALSARKTLKEHQAFLLKYPLVKMRSRDDEEAVHETLREIEEWILEDKMKQILTSQQQQGPSKKRRVWQDFEILRMSPVLCGMLKYCFHIQLQWKGITLLNDTGIVTTAHLYNALRQNGYLGKKNPVVWEDMEYLLDLHKAEDTFMGARPKSIEDCTKRLAMVQGVAPSTFIRRRRGDTNRVLRSRAGSRFLSPSTAVAQILGQRYLTQTNADWHLEQLDTIVGRKFDVDIKIINKYNEKMNAKAAGIDSTTEEGKLALIDAFCPTAEVLYGIIGSDRVPILDLKMYFVQIILDRHPESQNKDWAIALRTALAGLPDLVIADAEDDDDDEDISEREQEVEEGHVKNDVEDVAVNGGTQVLRRDQSRDLETAEDDETFGDAFDDVMERWKKTKTLPVSIFIDILQEALSIEYLDIQFDYFAFFRSAFSLMLELKEATSGVLRPRVLAENHHVQRMFELNECAVCIIPQLSLLVACDPLEAPNIISLRPWLEVDLRPLQMAAKIMRPWIEEHGDTYCTTEEEREEKRTENILKEGAKVRYVDDIEPGSSNVERKIGWSSALGVVEGLNAREMREIYDAMKDDSVMGKTVAETMALMKGIELSKEDRELAELNASNRKVLEGHHSKKKTGEAVELSSDEDSVD